VVVGRRAGLLLCWPAAAAVDGRPLPACKSLWCWTSLRCCMDVAAGAGLSPLLHLLSPMLLPVAVAAAVTVAAVALLLSSKLLLPAPLLLLSPSPLLLLSPSLLLLLLLLLLSPSLLLLLSPSLLLLLSPSLLLSPLSLSPSHRCRCSFHC